MQPGPAIYVCIIGEATLEAFEHLKTVFQEVKTLLYDTVKVTLDPENIPRDFVELPINLSYCMTYNELYVVNSLRNGKPGDEESQEDGPILEDIDKDCTVKSVFRINKETLETEYNLITLNLEKIKMINLKDVIDRDDKSKTSGDLQYLNDGTQV
jgi:hypothetical protein